MIKVSEINLKREYEFMYENFVVSSQSILLILLEKEDEKIRALRFNSLLYKYGYPNDEAEHPMTVYGLGSYGLFKVDNSSWIKEIKANNASHHRHEDSMFEKYEHYIARFKDVTIETICTKMEEIELTNIELLTFVSEQTDHLKK